MKKKYCNIRFSCLSIIVTVSTRDNDFIYGDLIYWKVFFHCLIWYNFIIFYLRVITYTYSGVNIFTNISVVPITPVRKIPIRHILSNILATYFHSSSWFGTKTSRSVEFSDSVSPGRVPLVWVSTSLVPFSFSCESLTPYFWAPLFPFSISDGEKFIYIRPKQNICLFKLPDLP